MTLLDVVITFGGIAAYLVTTCVMERLWMD